MSSSTSGLSGTHEQAFQLLNTTERKAFIGRIACGHSYEQIAANLGADSAEVARDVCIRAVSHLLNHVTSSTHEQSMRLSDLIAADAPDATPEERVLLHQLQGITQSMVPSHWGRLAVIGPIGTGGFGTVYRAWDPGLEQLVALKLYHRHHARQPKGELLDEARQLAKVNHPNVVRVYNAEEHDGAVGVWMELVEGETLDTEIRRGRRFTTSDAGAIGLAICEALTAVHAAGIVHGDIKANNVIRARDDRIVLMDFGAARTLRPDSPESDERLEGTPLYMAPERFDHPRPTVQSDIYAVGVLLFYLVSGRYPVEGCSAHAIRAAHRAGAPMLMLRTLRPDLRGEFVAVIEQALSRNVAQRPGKAAALYELLNGSMPDRQPAISWAQLARAGNWLLWTSLTIGAMGWAASRWFEMGLDIPSDFRTPINAYWIYGSYAAVLPAFYVLLSSVLVGVMTALLAPLRKQLTRTVKRAPGWIQSRNPSALATMVFIVALLVWSAIFFQFQELYSTVINLSRDGVNTPVARDVFNEGEYHALTFTSTLFTSLLLLIVIRWFPRLQYRVSAAATVRFLKWSIVAIALAASVSVAGFWRLRFQYHEVVTYHEHEWLVVATSGSQLLLHEPCLGRSAIVTDLPTHIAPQRVGAERRLFEYECE